MNFKTWLLEMSSGEVDQALKGIDYSNLKPENMPFDDMFKGKFRVLIPFKSEKQQKIIAQINNLGYEVIGDQTIKTIKTQRGEKKQKIRLTKVIQDNLGKEVLQEYLNSAWMILISRHPKDLMRMSDFTHLQSCHSPPSMGGVGNYWHCVAEEITAYGVIAYLIPSSQANNINLDADEVFKDEMRGIKGIVPHARMRLRSKKTDQGIRVMSPDPRMYGSDDDYIRNEFYNTLKSWVLQNSVHQDVYSNVNPFVARDKWKLLGGEYSDTSVEDLVGGMMPANYLDSAISKFITKYNGKKLGDWFVKDIGSDIIRLIYDFHWAVPNSGKLLLEHVMVKTQYINVEIKEGVNNIIVDVDCHNLKTNWRNPKERLIEFLYTLDTEVVDEEIKSLLSNKLPNQYRVSITEDNNDITFSFSGAVNMRKPDARLMEVVRKDFEEDSKYFKTPVSVINKSPIFIFTFSKSAKLYERKSMSCVDYISRRIRNFPDMKTIVLEVMKDIPKEIHVKEVIARDGHKEYVLIANLADFKLFVEKLRGHDMGNSVYEVMVPPTYYSNGDIIDGILTIGPRILPSLKEGNKERLPPRVESQGIVFVPYLDMDLSTIKKSFADCTCFKIKSFSSR